MRTTEELIRFLIRELLAQMPEYRREAARVPGDPESQRYLLRCLMNVWPPQELSAAFLSAQDELLGREREEKGVVRVLDLAPIPGEPQLVLWQGDITRLDAGAIVNAANSQLLGCFRPGHNCIDNVIHSAAGLQLRQECARIMREQGHEEPTGRAKLTGAYNLPAQAVLHSSMSARSAASPFLIIADTPSIFWQTLSKKDDSPCCFLPPVFFRYASGCSCLPSSFRIAEAVNLLRHNHVSSVLCAISS